MAIHSRTLKSAMIRLSQAERYFQTQGAANPLLLLLPRRVRFAANAQDNWEPYKGKRGDRKGESGWKNRVTGDVVWGEKPKGRKQPTPEQKAGMDKLKSRIKELRETDREPSVGNIREVSESLAQYSVGQLTELAIKMKLPTSKDKNALTKGIAKALLVGKSPAKPAKPSKSSSKPSGKPIASRGVSKLTKESFQILAKSVVKLRKDPYSEKSREELDAIERELALFPQKDLKVLGDFIGASYIKDTSRYANMIVQTLLYPEERISVIVPKLGTEEGDAEFKSIIDDFKKSGRLEPRVEDQATIRIALENKHTPESLREYAKGAGVTNVDSIPDEDLGYTVARKLLESGRQVTKQEIREQAKKDREAGGWHQLSQNTQSRVRDNPLMCLVNLT